MGQQTYCMFILQSDTDFCFHKKETIQEQQNTSLTFFCTNKHNSPYHITFAGK